MLKIKITKVTKKLLDCNIKVDWIPAAMNRCKSIETFCLKKCRDIKEYSVLQKLIFSEETEKNLFHNIFLGKGSRSSPYHKELEPHLIEYIDYLKKRVTVYLTELIEEVILLYFLLIFFTSLGY